MSDDKVVAAIRKLNEAFDREVFIRNTDHDGEPGWAMKLLPYIQALAVLNEYANAQEKAHA
jgi:hypothetical protein